MKKILLISALATTAISNVALADICPAQAAYNVFIGGTGVGTAAIAPTTLDVTSYAGVLAGQSSCAYGVTWTNPVPDAAVAKTTCSLAQFSTFGQHACGGAAAPLQNAFASPLISVSGCQGFDTTGAVHTLHFVLSPTGADCALNGLGTYTDSPFLIEPVAFH